MKKQLIDFENYPRKEQFKFFELNDDPIWGLTVEVDCTKTYETAKKNNYSFFQFYLHKALKAAIHTKEFRYRVENGQIYSYETLFGSSTIAKDDGTFGFAYFDYYEDFNKFSKYITAEIEKVKREIKTQNNNKQ